MHQHDDGTVSYTFPSEPHPQLEVPKTSKGKLGLKPMTNAAIDAKDCGPCNGVSHCACLGILDDEQSADALAMAVA